MGARTLILGMGSPILSDDGVGLLIVERLKPLLPEAECQTTHMVGLDLIDQVAGYDKIFLVDALTSPKGQKGALRKLTHDGTLHASSSHGLNFFGLLEMGQKLGLQMPAVGGVYGIEIGDLVCFGETLTPELQARIDDIIAEIARDIRAVLSLSAVRPTSGSPPGC